MPSAERPCPDRRATERPGAERPAAVVLAGGQSRRFGTDKLAHSVAGRPLLDHALTGLPNEFDIYLVGPPRITDRSVTVVREEPPGGGPAAGLIAGLSAALGDGCQPILVLPGDTPLGGAAALLLLERLRSDLELSAMIGVDPDGQLQPLLLGLRRSAAEQLVRLGGPRAGAQQSARRLVGQLDPPATPVPLPADVTFDVDTREQLRTWSGR